MLKVRIFYILLLSTLLVMTLFYCWLRIEQIRYGYAISELYEEYLELWTTNRKLKLEWDYLTSPAHLEEIGRDEFSMKPPKPDEITWLEVPEKLVETDQNDSTENDNNQKSQSLQRK